MKKCKYAKKYKAIHPPMCGGFDGPCEACQKKWDNRIAANKAKEQGNDLHQHYSDVHLDVV